jgi:hypothetical protein
MNLNEQAQTQLQCDAGGELRPASTWTVEGSGLQPPGQLNKSELDRPTWPIKGNSASTKQTHHARLRNKA